LLEKKSNTINENPTPAEKKLYSAICQRILAGNEKKKTVGKTTDHEKKKTPIAKKEKYQDKVLPGKIKLKKQKNDGEEMDSDDDELLEKKSHAAPGITKEKTMHDSEDEVQVIEETCEKQAVVGGNMNIEKPKKFNFVIESDEPKEQVYEAMTSNAKELTNLIMSPLTPDKERQLKEIIEIKEKLDKIESFWGEFLTWGSMQKLPNFDRKDKDMTKKWTND
jgi:hypothetical protein